MRKRSRSCSATDQTGIVCSNTDLCQILSGINLRKSSCCPAAKTTDGYITSDPNKGSSNFLDVKPQKPRARSLQPDVLSWDKEKQLSVQPELIGAVIESYIMNKKASSENNAEDTTSDEIKCFRSRPSLPPSLLVMSKTPVCNSRPSGVKSQTSPKEKRLIVVDEFDHIRRFSFGVNANLLQNVSSRQEESVESALKKMNV